MQELNVSYAQNREDVILNAFFDASETGFYVDVGANHPVHESVTKLFYDKGWSGINIEPTRWIFELLKLTRPRDVTIPVGVSNCDGVMQFREYPHGDGLSTFSAAMQQAYEKKDSYFTSDYVEYEVPVTTLAKIFAEQKVTSIDFMKVDVEGYEYEVLEGNDWKKYRPKVICIEANHIVKDWHPILKKASYEVAFFDGLNEYFVASEEQARLKSFSYPDRILLGERFISRREYLERQDTARELKMAEYKLNRAKAHAGSVPAANQPAGGRPLAKKLRRLDGIIEQKLASPRQAPPTDLQTSSPKTVAKFTDMVREQLSHHVRPAGHAQPKTVAHTAYRRAKKVARKTIKRYRP